jgi:hypothetical protein
VGLVLCRIRKRPAVGFDAAITRRNKATDCATPSSGGTFVGSCSPLDNQPAVVGRRNELREHPGGIDTAVARHGKDTIENSIEKARIAGANASEHLAPDILAVDMPDAARCRRMTAAGSMPT